MLDRGICYGGDWMTKLATRIGLRCVCILQRILGIEQESREESFFEADEQKDEDHAINYCDDILAPAPLQVLRVNIA